MILFWKSVRVEACGRVERDGVRAVEETRRVSSRMEKIRHHTIIDDNLKLTLNSQSRKMNVTRAYVNENDMGRGSSEKLSHSSALYTMSPRHLFLTSSGPIPCPYTTSPSTPAYPSLWFAIALSRVLQPDPGRPKTTDQLNEHRQHRKLAK